MASTNFCITIKKISTKQVIFRVRTDFNGNVNDEAASRSFALLILIEARKKTEEYRKVPIMLTELEKEAKTFPPNFFIDKPFMEQNVDKYILNTEIIFRGNRFKRSQDTDWIRAFVENVYAKEKDRKKREDILCEKLHFIDLLVTVTDTKWLTGIEKNWVFDTTAFDVWGDDPLNPLSIENYTIRQKWANYWECYYDMLKEEYYNLHESNQLMVLLKSIDQTTDLKKLNTVYNKANDILKKDKKKFNEDAYDALYSQIQRLKEKIIDFFE